MTIIYLDPSSPAMPLSFINNVSQTPAYKLAHFIAPNEDSFQLWRETIEGFLQERRGGDSEDWEELRWREAETQNNVEPSSEARQVVREDEVLRLCRRLGVGMGKEEIAAAFRVCLSPF